LGRDGSVGVKKINLFINIKLSLNQQTLYSGGLTGECGRCK